MNILILGGGGREHALAWAIRQNPKCDRLIVAPGNAGIAAIARCADLAITDGAAVAAFCDENAIDLVVIGPEAPLAAGVADALRAAAAIVSTERTCLTVKRYWSKRAGSRPYFVYVPHGSGDRNVAVHPALKDFDLSLVSGSKVRDQLVEAGVAKGRTLTSYPSIRTDLRNAGANVVDEEVARDGNLITSRSPGDLPVICATIGASFASNSTQEEVMA